MSRDDVLFWLNDRLGEPVAAGIWVTPDDDCSFASLRAQGVLRHWREDDEGDVWAAHQHPLGGLYGIGEAVLNLTELSDDADVVLNELGNLEIKLADGALLLVCHETATLATDPEQSDGATDEQFGDEGSSR